MTQRRQRPGRRVCASRAAWAHARAMPSSGSSGGSGGGGGACIRRGRRKLKKHQQRGRRRRRQSHSSVGVDDDCRERTRLGGTRMGRSGVLQQQQHQKQRKQQPQQLEGSGLLLSPRRRTAAGVARSTTKNDNDGDKIATSAVRAANSRKFVKTLASKRQINAKSTSICSMLAKHDHYCCSQNADNKRARQQQPAAAAVAANNISKRKYSHLAIARSIKGNEDGGSDEADDDDAEVILNSREQFGRSKRVKGSTGKAGIACPVRNANYTAVRIIRTRSQTLGCPNSLDCQRRAIVASGNNSDTPKNNLLPSLLSPINRAKNGIKLTERGRQQQQQQQRFDAGNPPASSCSSSSPSSSSSSSSSSSASGPTTRAKSSSTVNISNMATSAPAAPAAPAAPSASAASTLGNNNINTSGQQQRRQQQQWRPKQEQEAAACDEMLLIRSTSRAYKWHWTELDKSRECIIDKDKLGMCFHPHQSENAAACRGSEPFRRNGNYYYWEIHVQDKIYGTSVMFGLCTKEQRLHANEYCNLVGLDESGWSLSHKGLAWHNGTSRQYTSTFPINQPITIGLLYNTMRGELSYFMDGKNLGVAFSGLNDIHDDLYPVVGSTAKCTRMRLIGTYCGYVSLLERSCFTLLKSARGKTELIECLRQYRLPKNLLDYVAQEANVCSDKTDSIATNKTGNNNNNCQSKNHHSTNQDDYQSFNCSNISA